MCRGLVSTASDIFELFAQLDADIEKQLPLNRPLIKQFRNMANQNYGVAPDEIAYTCITHCVDKRLR